MPRHHPDRSRCHRLLGGRTSTEAEAWLGQSLLSECLDAHTGELAPIAVVTDNGPAYKSAAFSRYIAARPEFTHVRTRHRSPQTNGVVERFLLISWNFAGAQEQIA